MAERVDKIETRYIGDDGYTVDFNKAKAIADANMEKYGFQIHNLQSRESKLENELGFAKKLLIVSTVVPLVTVALILMNYLFFNQVVWIGRFDLILKVIGVPVCGVLLLVVLPININNYKNRAYLYGVLTEQGKYGKIKFAKDIMTIEESKRQCVKKRETYRLFMDDVLTRDDETNPEFSTRNHNVMTEKQKEVLDKLESYTLYKDYTVSHIPDRDHPSNKFMIWVAFNLALGTMLLFGFVFEWLVL